MKQLFLTSEVAGVARYIGSKISTATGGLVTAYITTPIERGHDGDDLAWHHGNRAGCLPINTIIAFSKSP